MKGQRTRFIPTRDWKEEIKGYCPCFSAANNKIFVDFNTPCMKPDFPEGSGCKAWHFRQLLLSHAIPSRIVFVTSLLRTGCFSRKQLITAVMEMYQTTYDNALLRVTATLRRCRQSKIYSLRRDDKNCLVLMYNG